MALRRTNSRANGRHLQYDRSTGAEIANIREANMAVTGVKPSVDREGEHMHFNNGAFRKYLKLFISLRAIVQILIFYILSLLFKHNCNSRS
jgi:hypothetical protein